MMRYVLNKCYGGFGISQEAMKILIAKDSSILEKTPLQKYNRGTENEEKINSNNFSSFWAENGLVYSLKQERSTETRSHKDLVEVVEQLGDKANAVHAKLRIIDCPIAPIGVEITEYDGIESLEEHHRSW